MQGGAVSDEIPCVSCTLYCKLSHLHEAMDHVRRHQGAMQVPLVKGVGGIIAAQPHDPVQVVQPVVISDTMGILHNAFLTTYNLGLPISK